MSIEVVTVEQRHHWLGRQQVHDSRSRAFPLAAGVDKSLWRTKAIRIYDPIPNPEQKIGCCTMCANAMMLNSLGNRVTGQVLNYAYAETGYSLATTLDPFPGQWPPTDTGSSGLAAAKAAQQMGTGGEYRHIFGGADEVIAAVMTGRVVSVGTWWYDGMFSRKDGVVSVTGPRVGGHQYVIRGYDKARDLAKGRCWWGAGFRDFDIRRGDLNDLMLDGGDGHVQDRKK